MTLNELSRHETASITSLNFTGDIKRRMVDMGIFAGNKITLLRRAPFNDPSEYTILGYKLCLRRSDAEKIIIKKDGV